MTAKWRWKRKPEWWYLKSVHFSKPEALRKAKGLKARGRRAKVTSGLGMHSVYVHRKE